MAPSRSRCRRFVSTLAICIVFVPVLLLTGPAKFLFTPLALAVAFAMLMSYFLTRTLVPTMVHYMLRPGSRDLRRTAKKALLMPKGLIWKTHHAFNTPVRENARANTAPRSAGACTTASASSLVYGLFVLASLGLFAVVGTDFFPYIDSGQIRLHVRAPEGTRIEETERVFGRVEQTIRADSEARRTHRHHRQHRPAQRLLRSGVGRQRHHQRGRRRNPDFAQ